eukprot:11220633-Lingulodinium_polyedra.AAC.1
MLELFVPASIPWAGSGRAILDITNMFEPFRIPSRTEGKSQRTYGRLACPDRVAPKTHSLPAIIRAAPRPGSRDALLR